MMAGTGSGTVRLSANYHAGGNSAGEKRTAHV